jgi:hypothetical protein
MLARSQMLLKGEKKSPDNVVWDKKKLYRTFFLTTHILYIYRMEESH